jgi:hypothetical protein
MAEAPDDAAAPNASRPASPPKPRFALTVGIVGHRLDFWVDPDPQRHRPDEVAWIKDHRSKVRDDVHTALKAIKCAAAQAYQNHASLFDNSDDAKQHAPELTLVSALADGADTFAANAAHELGYAIDAPLPFSLEDYAHDFDSAAVDQHTPAPIESFRDLVGKARSVLELPGQRGDDLLEARAYEAAGLTVLSQADIVLAVWDRGLPRGRGGSAEMVAEAARVGLPIILVDAIGKKPIELHWRGLMLTPAPIVAFDDLPSATLGDSINRVVDELVRPPRAPEQGEDLAAWYKETPHGINLGISFPLLMGFLFARRMRLDLFPRRPDELADDYVKDAKATADPRAREQIKRVAEPYGWADAVGIYCAQLFRSAFVINFFFAAFAVIAATASVMMMRRAPFWQHVPIAIELVLILFVVGNTFFGRLWRWHHRWVEAREVAERLRVALPLWTLGLRPASFPGEEPTWTGWYVRALVRMQGLRHADLASHCLQTEREVLLALLNSQCGYNHSNARRMHWLERALELAGACLLAATVLVAVDHLADSPVMGYVFGHFMRPDEAPIWLSAALPALATATYGIRVIGDFEGISQRGERTYRQLDQLVAAIQQDPADFTLLRARARTAADAMLGDVSSWRLSAESRGLAIPG